jgi:hypothetical protein
LTVDRPPRVEIEEDKRLSNASCIRMHLEDHTLGKRGMIHFQATSRVWPYCATRT